MPVVCEVGKAEHQGLTLGKLKSEFRNCNPVGSCRSKSAHSSVCRAALCAHNLKGWPAHRFFEALLRHEVIECESRYLYRHRAESNLCPDKRLPSFDFSSVASASRAQVTALAVGTQWLERGANVLPFWLSGVGKGHLVSSMDHAMIASGR